MEYKLVLVKDIHKFEAEGWVLKNKNVVRQMGGVEWSSVWMVREEND